MNALIVHEWLENRGGAERVVDGFRAAFPEADLLALWNDAPQRYPEAKETWLAKTPFRRHKVLAAPVSAMTWRTIGRRTAAHDWLLVSSHLFAHHVTHVGDAEQPKYVYAHTPARYIWDTDQDDRSRSAAATIAGPFFRKLDRHRAKEATAVAANSRFIRTRIENAWERDAKVIYPPVDIETIRSIPDWAEALDSKESAVLDLLPEMFILGASRFVRYKKLDWVIEASRSLGVPVVIAGRGPDESRLRAYAASIGADASFVIDPSDALLYALYSRCAVYAFPPVEDFGIMPVEAQAAGAMVATTAWGGAVESLAEGITGTAALGPERSDFTSAVDRALRLERGSDEHLQEFSLSTFVGKVRQWVNRGA